MVDLICHSPRDPKARQTVTECHVVRSEYDGQSQTTCIEAHPVQNVVLAPEMQYAICVESYSGDGPTPVCVCPFGLADLRDRSKTGSGRGEGGTKGMRTLVDPQVHGPPLHSLSVHLEDNNHFLGKMTSYRNLVKRLEIVFSTKE